MELIKKYHDIAKVNGAIVSLPKVLRGILFKLRIFADYSRDWDRKCTIRLACVVSSLTDQRQAICGHKGGYHICP